MIALRTTRIGNDLSTDVMMSGPTNEIATLFQKLHTAFFFDPTLHGLLDKKQVTEIKDTLERIYGDFKRATA
jgi:hypothetical protein